MVKWLFMENRLSDRENLAWSVSLVEWQVLTFHRPPLFAIERRLLMVLVDPLLGRSRKGYLRIQKEHNNSKKCLRLTSTGAPTTNDKTS